MNLSDYLCVQHGFDLNAEIQHCNENSTSHAQFNVDSLPLPSIRNVNAEIHFTPSYLELSVMTEKQSMHTPLSLLYLT